MAKKDVRKFKVYEQSGCNYKPTPTIILRGFGWKNWALGRGRS